MQIERDRPTEFRVLMRIPKLRQHLASQSSPASATPQTGTEPAPPKPEFEISEVTQQVADDIATARQGHRLLRPVLVAQVLALVVAILLALMSWPRGDDAPPPGSPSAMEIPVVSVPDVSPEAIPGGSPTAITSIPELSLPTDNQAAGPDWTIERLPEVPVEQETDVSQISLSASNAVAGPGMARLDSRIETPKPEATYDSTRSGVY